MNKAIITGNLTKQAELRFTPGVGKAVASFTIAINEGWGDKKKTTYINCVAWGKTAEALASYTDKGSKVAVVGRIQVRDYEKDGIKRYVTEVVADEVEFLDKKGNTPATQEVNNEFENVDLTAMDDGDIPF